MNKPIAVGIVSVLACAAFAEAQISSLNGFRVRVRNFNDFPLTTGTFTDAGGPQALPGAQEDLASPGISGLRIEESFAQFSQGNFANRHLAFFSNDGGATEYALQNNQGFRVNYRMRLATTGPTGVGSPINSEGGFWIHNPRVNEQGNTFIDEGGLFTVTNGTVFVGGAGMGFSLLGEGGFNNPNVPPLYTAGGLADVSFIYNAPGDAGALASYRVIFTDQTSGRTVDTGDRPFAPIIINNVPTENGFNNGAVIGFRFQHSRNPLIQTDIDHQIGLISIIPAPSAAAVMGLGLLVAGRRRRA